MDVPELDNGPRTTLSEYPAVLEHEVRRGTVKILAEEDRPLDLWLLAGWLAAGREEVPLDAVDPREVAETKIRLHHSHLPKLEEAGFVHYDTEKSRIVPAERTSDVRSHGTCRRRTES